METATDSSKELDRCVEILRAIVKQARPTSDGRSARTIAEFGEHRSGLVPCFSVPCETIGRAEGALRMLDLAEGSVRA